MAATTHGRGSARGQSKEQPSVRIRLRYRLGIYNPLDESEPAQLIGSELTDSDEDRKIMRDVTRRYRRWSASRPHITHCLGVFPVVNSHALT
jgi:hypothetical protein